MEWSNEQITQFLELYEGEPSIWNPSDANHKIRNHVHDAWGRISKNLSGAEYSISELKKKKDSLMGTYRKLSLKVKASKKTGSGTDGVFKPEWFAYEHMARFMHGVFQPRQTKNSEALADKSTSDIVIDEDDGDHEQYEEEANEEMNTTTPSVTHEESVNPLINRKKSKKDCNKKIIENRMDEAYNILKKVSNAPISDEYSLYSELLAKKLRNLKDDNTREFAMHEIDNFLYALKQNNTEALTRFSDQYRLQPSSHYQTSQNNLTLSSHSQPSPNYTNISQHYQTPQAYLAPLSHSQPSSDYTNISQHYQTPQAYLAPSSHSQPSPDYTNISQHYQTPQAYLAPSSRPRSSPEYTNLLPHNQAQETYLAPLPRPQPSPELHVPSPQNHNVASLLNSQISSDYSNSQSSNINASQNKKIKTSVSQNEISFDGLFKKS